MVQATGIISVSPPLDYGGVGGILIPPTLIPFGVRARSTGFGAAGADTRPECGVRRRRRPIFFLQIEQRAGLIYAIGTRDHCAVGLREPWCVWYVRVAPARSLQLGTNSDTFPSPGIIYLQL